MTIPFVSLKAQNNHEKEWSFRASFAVPAGEQMAHSLVLV
jgi:hypothetical protein